MAGTTSLPLWLPDASTVLIFATCVLASTSITQLSSAENTNHDYPELVQFSHFNEPYDERVLGKIQIELTDVSPSFIEVKWLLRNRTLTDSVVEFTFLLETVNGRIVSNKLYGNTDSFRFEFLSPSTRYVICVHLLEKSVARNTSSLHYSCQPFSTIPVVRLDSILGVVLTAAYFILMVVLGYLAWYRRSRRSKSNDEEKEEEERLKIEDDDETGDTYFQFVKAAGRGGFSNYTAADEERQDETSGINGGSAYKAKTARGDCSGACIPFTAKEEEQLVEYNAKLREISF